MSDNNLTDNEIIKAQEYCCKVGNCDRGCPLADKCKSPIKTMEDFIKFDLNLIYDLQAKNEKLEQKIKAKEWNVIHPFDFYEQVKVEAYKEVGEKIDKITWYHINKNGELVMGANSEMDIPLYKAEDIYNLLKELVGTNFTQMFAGVKKLQSISEKELVGE